MCVFRLASTVMYTGQKDAGKLSIAEQVGLQVLVEIPAAVIDTLGIDEIVDPLLEYRVRFCGVSVLSPTLPSTLVLEKAAIAAEELEANYVLMKMQRKELDRFRKLSDELFEIFSSYKIGLCVETNPENAASIRELILDKIGGVFWIALSPSEDTSTRRFIDTILYLMRLLKIIKMVNYTKRGASFITDEGNINYYSVLRALVENYYDGVIVLDYDSKGLDMYGEKLSYEVSIIRQYAASLPGRDRI